MLSIFLALMTSFGYGTADFLAGRVTQRLNPTLVVLYVQSLQGIAILTLALISKQPLELPGLLWGISAGLLDAIGLMLYYQALKIGRSGIAASIVGSSAILPVLAAVMQGTLPSVLACLGLLTVLFGIAAVTRFVSLPSSEPTLALSQASEPQLRPNQPHKNYIKLSTIAAIAFGVSFILIEHGSSVAHNGVLWVTLGAQIGALPITLSNLLKASQISSRKIWVTSILTTLGVMTALNLGADISLAYAFRFGNLGITGVLASLGPVITIMLARFMTTERLSKMQTIGAGLILFGTLMVVHEMH